MVPQMSIPCARRAGFFANRRFRPAVLTIVAIVALAVALLLTVSVPHDPLSAQATSDPGAESVQFLTMVAHAPLPYLLPPTIREPAFDGQVINPADVHMEAAPMDPGDSGLEHICSDWEIWRADPLETAWRAPCVEGPISVHIHLGDGAFTGSHAPFSELLFETDYILRLRYRNSSGNPDREWSRWAERRFRTGASTDQFAMDVKDVRESPAPTWQTDEGAPVILAPEERPGELRLEAIHSATMLRAPVAPLGMDSPQHEDEGLLLRIQAGNGISNTVENPPARDEHGNLRLTLHAGATAGISVPPSQLAFADDLGRMRIIYLPAVTVEPGTEARFWVSADGGTYVAGMEQTEPDFSQVGRESPIPWIVEQPGFRLEKFATDLQMPVNIAFVPNPGPDADDPFLYATELYGTVKMVTRSGNVYDYACCLLNYDPLGAIPGSGEMGLAGLVVEPTTGDLLVSLVYADLDNPGRVYGKVVRLQSEDGGRTAAGQTTVLDLYDEPLAPSHQISSISLGPDGKLYVHVGDGLRPETAPNLGLYRGKILRVNLDGTPPADNPFFDPANGIDAADYVYARSFRNPFGGAWRQSTGDLWAVENGPSANDRLMRILPGEDYGWDGDEADMLINATYVWSRIVAPVNITFIQPTVFNGSGFPAEKMDRAYVSESGATWASGPQRYGKRISEFTLDAGGNLVSGPDTVVRYNGTGKATVIAIAAGPDGLYFSDFYKDRNYASPVDRGSNIWRIVYVE